MGPFTAFGTAPCAVAGIPAHCERFTVRWLGAAEGRYLSSATSGAHRALCPRCAKSRLFSTPGSHGFQGPEVCTLQPLLVHQGFLF